MPPELPFQTIVYATDFSAGAQNAGNYAALLAKQFAAELVVAHAFVLTNPAMEAEATPRVKSRQRLDLETALAAVAAKYGEGLTRTATVLLEGDASEEIPRVALGVGSSETCHRDPSCKLCLRSGRNQCTWGASL